MIALAPNGKPLYVGVDPLKLVDGAPPVIVAPPSPGGAMPSASLAGWWDASTLTAGASASSISDSSAAGKTATTSPAQKAVARRAGLLPGLYSEGGASNYTLWHPIINDSSVSASNIAVGTGQAFTVFLVWSRPNLRQSSTGVFSNADVPLIAIGGVTLLSLTAAGDGADTLKLFPAGAPVTGGALSVRHTHSARVVFNGSTVDVWLDGTKVISGAANQITLGATANLSFLSASQCIFHEAAAWNVALGATAHAALTSYATRWPLGPRRAVIGLTIGQSNVDLVVQFNANQTLDKAVAYWTGALASNLISTFKISTGKLSFSGQGLYSGTSSGLFLDSSSGAGNVANWPLGTNGNAYMAAINALSADQKESISYIFWFWSESDSGMLTYANKATYAAAMRKAFGYIRTGTGKTAAQLPILVINALPFNTAVGCQTHREVMQDLVNDSALNCRFMLAQSDDAIGQSDTWDSVTGLEAGGGNNAHRDSAGMNTFVRRCAIPIARAVIAAKAASGTPDAITAIDASVPTTCGPRVASAVYEGATHAPTGSVLVTVTHDKGTDLSLPLRAALGVGWALMDGVGTTPGTPGAPGALIAATACARVSATQLRVTLASQPANPGAALLYYVYGTGLDGSNYATIGQGNAVMDNFASQTLAAGWRIGADMGAAAQPNNPLQATTYGVPLT